MTFCISVLSFFIIARMPPLTFYEITGLFFQALATMNMDVTELYKRYLIKNQLNT
jgi:hypothetical protein